MAINERCRSSPTMEQEFSYSAITIARRLLNTLTSMRRNTSYFSSYFFLDEEIKFFHRCSSRRRGKIFTCIHQCKKQTRRRNMSLFQQFCRRRTGTQYIYRAISHDKKLRFSDLVLMTFHSLGLLNVY